MSKTQPQTDAEKQTHFPGVTPAPVEPKAKRGSKTKLYFFFQRASGENDLLEFDDKVALDLFLEANQVTPISLIRGSARAFKNRLVLV